jgi:tellurite resistance protein TerA
VQIMAIDYSKSSDSPTPGGPPVSLSKVTLTKTQRTVSLSKQGGGGRLSVNLNWNARPAGTGGGGGGGFLKRVRAAAVGGGGIDLDLACLYELADGQSGAVQALGNSFGSLTSPPYVRLEGDDRTGASAGGENLHVNLDHTRDIRRLLIFAFIYSGVPAWDQADAVVTLTPAQGAPIEVRLDEHAAGAPMCAIALLTNNGGNDFTVSREVRYVGGHRELDAAYGWGLQWTAGRK